MFSCSLAGSSVENVCLHITFNHLMQRVCVCACALKSDLMVAFSDGQSSDAGPLLGRGTGMLVRKNMGPRVTCTWIQILTLPNTSHLNSELQNLSKP